MFRLSYASKSTLVRTHLNKSTLRSPENYYATLIPSPGGAKELGFILRRAFIETTKTL